MEKSEVEELLGYSITNSQFEEALGHAKRKQENIYKREGSRVVLQRWYLVKLTEEYIRKLAFSKFTVDLCRELRNMENEHSTKSQSAQQRNHIVTVLAL